MSIVAILVMPYMEALPQVRVGSLRRGEFVQRSRRYTARKSSFVNETTPIITARTSEAGVL